MSKRRHRPLPIFRSLRLACLAGALSIPLSATAVDKASSPELTCHDGKYSNVLKQQSDGGASVVTFQLRDDPAHLLSVSLVSYGKLDLPQDFHERPTGQQREHIYALLATDAARLLENISKTRIDTGEVVQDGGREFFRLEVGVAQDKYTVFHYVLPHESAVLIGRFTETNAYEGAISPAQLLHDALEHCVRNNH